MSKNSGQILNHNKIGSNSMLKFNERTYNYNPGILLRI